MTAQSTDTEKASKREANYRAGRGDRRCSNCTMFVPPKREHDTGSCTSVRGDISPRDLCDYFERK